ncbi:hypothetical protein GQ600_24477 [Phytophthora cactorum]|nr:hypothetical protein GQ600_18288 [Phytophthora cactorum]KAF1784001.1 hypothetical protein GQ600_24477 [Phytophthora cactorum]
MYILERSPLCPNDRTADRVDRMGDAFTATCTCIVVNNDGFVIRSPCSLAVPNEILLIGGVKQAAWESCQRQRLAQPATPPNFPLGECKPHDRGRRE